MPRSCLSSRVWLPLPCCAAAPAAASARMSRSGIVQAPDLVATRLMRRPPGDRRLFWEAYDRMRFKKRGVRKGKGCAGPPPAAYQEFRRVGTRPPGFTRVAIRPRRKCMARDACPTYAGGLQTMQSTTHSFAGACEPATPAAHHAKRRLDE